MFVAVIAMPPLTPLLGGARWAYLVLAYHAKRAIEPLGCKGAIDFG